MNGQNTGKISPVLKKYDIDYIPEAHNYLKYEDLVLDFTRAQAKPTDFIPDLLTELEIAPEQITEFKVAYHKEYLSNWLSNEHITSYTLNDIWRIREECIQALSA